MNSKFDNEMLAYDALTKLLVEARRVAGLFEAAGAECPSPVARMLGSTNGANVVSATVEDSTSVRASSPQVKGDLITVPINAISTTGLVLGILRDAGKPLRLKEIVACVKKYRPRSAMGSIYNVGSRLEGDVIKKASGRWSLYDKTRAPKLEGNYAIGPTEVFSMHELAAHRRELICEILYTKPAGLTTTQVVGELESSGKCVAPASKDIVIVDLRGMLKYERVRRIKKMWKIP